MCLARGLTSQKTNWEMRRESLLVAVESERKTGGVFFFLLSLFLIVSPFLLFFISSFCFLLHSTVVLLVSLSPLCYGTAYLSCGGAVLES